MFSWFKKKNSPAPEMPLQPESAPSAPDSLAVAADAGLVDLADAAPAPVTTPNPTEPTAAPVAPSAELDLLPSTSWMRRLRLGLARTGGTLSAVFMGQRIDEALYESLEAALLTSDAGMLATDDLLQLLQKRVRAKGMHDASVVREELRSCISEALTPLQGNLCIREHGPTVILVAGVNGAGKTTTIGKLTKHLCDQDARVLLAAGDTFRAAAKEQLMQWAQVNQVQLISQDGADPAAVAFDAVSAGVARKVDVVLIDTAGRLGTQGHLMEELKKIRRVIQKAHVDAPHECLLVIDGNTGQNALAQVAAFDEALTLSGLIVTKLDGTAKGGVLLAIARLAQQRVKPLPVYFIGVGEKPDDLQPFQADEFARALLS